MPTRSAALSTIVKLWLLAMIAGALWYISSDRAAPPTEGRQEAAEAIARTSVDVRVGVIEKKTLRQAVVAYGTVEAAPASVGGSAAISRLTVDWPAVIPAVRCVEGQPVHKGEPLFVCKGADVVSPIDGTVTMVDIHPGEVALPTRPVVEIVDLNRLVLAAGASATVAGALKVGTPATIQLPGGEKIESKVQRIDPAADTASGLVGVDVAIPAGHGAMRGALLGQFAKVTFYLHEVADALVAPADAIVRDSLDRPEIAVVSEDRKEARLEPIQLGISQDDEVQVIGDDLSAGQTIVVGGAYALNFRSDIHILNP
jgi:multidrug efflux pump subunit AcrA (membrane-fusion protein)